MCVSETTKERFSDRGLNYRKEIGLSVGDEKLLEVPRRDSHWCNSKIVDVTETHVGSYFINRVVVNRKDKFQWEVISVWSRDNSLKNVFRKS